MENHALLSPSSAFRWMHCTQSPHLNRKIPDTPNPAADRGTLGHLLAEALLSGAHWSDLIATTDSPYLTEDLVKQVDFYVSAAQTYKKENQILEAKLSIEHITGEKDATGTADLVYYDNDSLIIIDAKFGNTPVRAEGNQQLMIYAAAAAKSLDYKGSVLTVIIQPAHGVSEATYTYEELNAFSVSVRQAAIEVFSNPTYRPSDASCKWCKGKAYCPGLAELMFEVVSSEDKPLHELAEYTSLARKWADAVDERLLATLLSGEPVKGWTLGVGRKGNRKWVSEDAAVAALGSHAYTQTLITPTKAAPFLTPSQMKELTYQEEGKPVAQKDHSMDHRDTK